MPPIQKGIRQGRGEAGQLHRLGLCKLQLEFLNHRNHFSLAGMSRVGWICELVRTQLLTMSSHVEETIKHEFLWTSHPQHPFLPRPPGGLRFQQCNTCNLDEANVMNYDVLDPKENAFKTQYFRHLGTLRLLYISKSERGARRRPDQVTHQNRTTDRKKKAQFQEWPDQK